METTTHIEVLPRVWSPACHCIFVTHCNNISMRTSRQLHSDIWKRSHRKIYTTIDAIKQNYILLSTRSNNYILLAGSCWMLRFQEVNRMVVQSVILVSGCLLQLCLKQSHTPANDHTLQYAVQWANTKQTKISSQWPYA